jgi:origin recognition complex subunit 3
VCTAVITAVVDLKFITRLRITALEDIPLWDIWYTGSTPFPSEVFTHTPVILNGCKLIRSLFFSPQLINPSPRASILAGLIHPQDYISAGQPSGDDDDDEELPDTSILFKGYLESGKMINVYDWFESFAVVLEARKRQLVKKHITDGKHGNSGTPSKKKGKQKQVEVDNEDAEGDEEEWHMEVQARFIRALQELDYLGFIKHTGRKVDHVMRIVFDSPE